MTDLEGATVCPGFYDSHAHMDREGLKARGGFSLAGRRSVEAIVEGVRLGVERTPPGEWAVLMPLGTPKLNGSVANLTRNGELSTMAGGGAGP